MWLSLLERNAYYDDYDNENEDNDLENDVEGDIAITLAILTPVEHFIKSDA